MGICGDIICWRYHVYSGVIIVMRRDVFYPFMGWSHYPSHSPHSRTPNTGYYLVILHKIPAYKQKRLCFISDCATFCSLVGRTYFGAYLIQSWDLLGFSDGKEAGQIPSREQGDTFSSCTVPVWTFVRNKRSCAMHVWYRCGHHMRIPPTV